MLWIWAIKYFMNIQGQRSIPKKINFKNYETITISIKKSWEGLTARNTREWVMTKSVAWITATQALAVKWCTFLCTHSPVLTWVLICNITKHRGYYLISEVLILTTLYYIFVYKLWRTKGFLQFKITINVLFSTFCLIKFLCYGSTAIIHILSLSVWWSTLDVRFWHLHIRQNLLSKIDPHTERPKFVALRNDTTLT